jgi:hypothetical protein
MGNSEQSRSREESTMIIRIKNTGAEVSVANDIGFAFCQAGLAEEVRPPKKEIVQKTSWAIVEQPVSGEIGISAVCNRCAAKIFFTPNYQGGRITNFSGKFTHCVAPPESIPEEIIKEYKRRFFQDPEWAADRALTERHQRESQSQKNAWSNRDLIVATGGLYTPPKD